MSASQKEPKKAKTRYEGELTANSKRNRPATYYKLSEKDHATIKAGLIHFVSVYQIAAKIGCGYTTLKQYIAKHPELKDCQEDAQKGELEFVKGKFMKKIAEGSLGAMCFYLERKGGWTNKQTVAADVPLPNIVLGVIPESELPTEGEPIKLTQIVQKEDIAAETADREAEKERAEQEAIVRQEDAAEASKPLPTPEVSEEDSDDDWGDEGTPQIF